MENHKRKIAQLRTDILVATADIIGSYQLPGQQETLPAIAIDDRGNFPPPGTQTSGLEIVVVPFSDLKAKPLLGGSRRWDCGCKLILKQWDESKDTLAALERIVPLLGNKVKIGPRLLPNDKLGSIESQSIEFILR